MEGAMCSWTWEEPRLSSQKEQIRGERYRIGERTRALLFLVEETHRGINLFLSRSHPKFIAKLFELEIRKSPAERWR